MTRVGVTRRRIFLTLFLIVCGVEAESETFGNRLLYNDGRVPSSIANILAQPHPQGGSYLGNEGEEERMMMMESKTTATYHLPPNDELPNINAKPVLQIHHHPDNHINMEEMNSIRHRRRLMLHPEKMKEEDKNKESRPPKEFIIYSLPEQSFWPQGHLGSPPPKMEEEEEVSSEEEEEEEFIPTNNSVTTVKPPPSSTNTPPPTSTTPPSEKKGGATIGVGLSTAEKKGHLGQCIKYCMDAIL